MKSIFVLLATLTALPALAGADLPERINVKRLELALLTIQALDANQVCDSDAYPNEAIQLVTRAAYAVSPATLKGFLAKVPASSEIRKSLAFRLAAKIVNFNDTTTPAQMESAFRGTVFFGPSRGAYGNTTEVHLLANGKAKIRVLEVLNDAPWSRWTETMSTWSTRNVKGEFNSLKQIVSIGGTDYELRTNYQYEGVIYLIPASNKSEDPWNADDSLKSGPDYCDA